MDTSNIITQGLESINIAIRELVMTAYDIGLKEGKREVRNNG